MHASSGHIFYRDENHHTTLPTKYTLLRCAYSQRLLWLGDFFETERKRALLHFRYHFGVWLHEPPLNGAVTSSLACLGNF